MARNATLYVARDKRQSSRHDVGSVLCLQLVEAVSPALKVTVHQCDNARDRPPWLTGTPTLHEDNGSKSQGFEAVQRLQTIAMEVAEARGRDARRKPTATAAQGPSVAARSASVVQSDVAVASGNEDDDMWGSRIDDNDEEVPEPRKISADDLARANASRQISNASVQQAPRSLPPVNA